MSKSKDRPGYERLAVGLVDQLGQMINPLHNVASTLVSDVYQAAIGHQTDFSNQQGHWMTGNIVMALPFLHWYKVQLGDGGSDLACCRLGVDGTFTALGVRDGTTLPPDTGVFVYRHPTLPFGYITGVLPSINQSGKNAFPDWIFQGSTCGFQREGHYSGLLSMLTDDDSVFDFSAGRPLDGTILDWTKTTELGGRIHIDPFMIQTAIDEMCGLSLFYHDQLARLAGINLELLSAGHLESYKDDEGEYQGYQGHVLYPWEAIGAFKPGVTIHKETGAKAVQYEGKRGTLEPATDDQQPFHRLRIWNGYLGQGHMREMVLPPQHEEVNRLGQAESVGVFREQVFPDGAYVLQSAKSIVIAKRQCIPVPTQLKRPEDYSEKADSLENNNYKASGYYGDGSKHVVKDIKVGEKHPQLVTPAAIFDVHAYSFNWKGLHPFHYHKKDYKISQEPELELSKVQSVPEFSSLKSTTWLSRPKSKKLRVDHRYGDVEYFEATSHMSLTDDGGVVIGDGYGSEIRMVGGNIVISCPGDVLFQPGRNVVALAGDDIVMRARNSVDVTSSDKDVRIKAKANVQVLAGNGGKGGILLESKATSTEQDFENKVGEDVISSGIIFKAANSQVATMAHEIYLRTGSKDGGITPGKIVLDADKGNNDIEMVASRVVRWIDTEARDYYGSGSSRTYNIWSNTGASINTQLNIRGYTRINSGLMMRGYLNILSGHVSTENCPPSGKVSDLKLNPAALSRSHATMDAVIRTAVAEIEKADDKYRERVFYKYHDTKKIGNAKTQESASVTLRNEKQYGTENFVLVETHWQQVARGVGAGAKWEEDVVEVAGKELMPYPGKIKWSDEATYHTLDNVLYSVKDGTDKNRNDSRYETPQFANWQTAKPEGSYVVI